MRELGRVKKFLPLIIVLLVFLTLGVTFLSRSPVLIVTDPSFNLMYGIQRQRMKVIKASTQLFRRVVPVLVDERVGPDLVVLVVEEASRSPWAVLFPHRYLEGAQFYKNSHPEVPVLVMEGRSPKPRASVPAETQLIFFDMDTAGDLYRAGLCAAVITGDAKRVLFFSDEPLPNFYREAFRAGLRDLGFLGDPIYVSASSLDSSSYSDVGCAVVTGPAARFLERNQNIPMILFSWIDPALTPRTVKILFDDSPLALAVRVLKALPGSTGDILVSSQPMLFLDRIEEKKDFRALQGILKGNFQKNSEKTGPES